MNEYLKKKVEELFDKNKHLITNECGYTDLQDIIFDNINSYLKNIGIVNGKKISIAETSYNYFITLSVSTEDFIFIISKR